MGLTYKAHIKSKIFCGGEKRRNIEMLQSRVVMARMIWRAEEEIFFSLQNPLLRLTINYEMSSDISPLTAKKKKRICNHSIPAKKKQNLRRTSQELSLIIIEICGSLWWIFVVILATTRIGSL